MSWRALCALLLLIPLAPVAQAAPARSTHAAPARSTHAAPARCDITQVETLTVRLGKAPKTLPAGKTFLLTIEVLRAAGTPAEDGAEGVEVLVGLTGKGWGAYAQLMSDAQGRAVARLPIPRKVRGATELDVDAFRELVALPCLTVEEHGRVVTPWASVR